MPIEINGLNAHKSRQTTARSTSKSGKSSSGGTTSQTPASADDTVSLTNTAANLKQIEDRLASQPVVDDQRIQAVQDAIRSGEYHVDPEKVADKIIEMEAGLDKPD